METNKITDHYTSADGIHRIQYHIFYPHNVSPIGIVQIAHGMCDYFERYSEMSEYLVNKGFIVCGNDHLGHGGSVNSNDELGWFAKENGWENAVEDMYTLTKIMKEKYSDIPYFLIGHSMGSFLSRAYTIKHSKSLDGVIFMGTSGGVEILPELLTVVDFMKKRHGDNYRSEHINKLVFGAYNRKILPRRNDYDWVSRDNLVTDKFATDPKTNFIFTLNGFENLGKVLWYVSNKKWYENYPTKLPTFLMAGSEDPVGNYGKGVEKVFNNLKKQNANVSLKIYYGARHELPNEINRQEVFSDVYDFLFNIINRS